MSFSSMGPTMHLDQEIRTRKQLPFLAKSSRTTSAKRSSQHFPDIPNEDGPGPHTPIRTEAGERGEMVVVNTPNLEKMVEDLGLKIAELTALVMAQQGTQPDESL